ncbi:carbohydrate ABC transporter permease [Limnochorda pilosa]|uniref:ABC transporter permease n=1 Tax=Limnochorda pilosa TaxID=1555112 RepID=A0A0K2SJ48_LIMPI|nr:carbohydrate ABC transporter permease [Limnochorda pilosa]BAS27128.1 ABC transporter permease [Limnochorda pilosa]
MRAPADGPEPHARPAGARRWRVLAQTKRVGLYLAVGAIVIWTLAPVTWLFLSAISPYSFLVSDRVGHWIPPEPTLRNFTDMWSPATDTGTRFRMALANSTVVSLSVTAICLVVGTFAAYALARLEVPHRKGVVLGLVVVRMLPTIALVIPFFVVVSQIDAFLVGHGSNVHLFDTRANLILLYISFILGFVIWVLQGYFRTVPAELEEAATIDGCSRLGALRHVVLPLSAPALMATALLAFLLAWDEFVLALVFTRSPQSATLPLFVAELGSQYITAHNQIAAAGFVAALPPVVLALAFQRFLVAGLTAGAVKS